MKKSFALIAFALLALSCDKSDDPLASDDTGSILITIDAEDGSLDKGKSWFIAWNKNGKLLDFEEYSAGDQITLKGDPAIDNFTLGYASYYKEGDFENYSIKIYTDLTPGVTFTRKKPAAVTSATEKFIYHFTGGSTGESVVSTRNGSVVDSFGMCCNLIPGATKYLISVREDDATRYSFFTDVTNGENVEVKNSDLIPYENNVTLNMPAGYDYGRVTLNGFEDGQTFNDGGYALEYFSPYNKSDVQVGYFPSISKFATQMTFSAGGKWLGYFKLGDLPGTITWPDISKYTVNSSQAFSLSLSAAADYEYIYGDWGKYDAEGSFKLSISSPRLDPTIGKMPDEILNNYPKFLIDAVHYPAAWIYFVTSGSRTYTDMVSEYLSGANDAKEQTLVAIQIH